MELHEAAVAASLDGIFANVTDSRLAADADADAGKDLAEGRAAVPQCHFHAIPIHENAVRKRMNGGVPLA
jgi:hypothetical protein